MVSYTCNLNYSGDIDQQDHSWKTSQAKSVHNPVSTKKNCVWLCLPVIPTKLEA
jgi:hypothetical protein